MFAAGWWVVDNVADNLRRQNIASGFGFLGRTSGFDVSQSLISYSSTSTYGRAFWVGLLNTLLVAGIGIVAATVLGFVLGIARLSSNWLIAKLAAAYVEVVRNVPLLLQLFFWYFAVLKSLPGPRQSHVLPGGAFLNVRGLYLPAPVPEPGFGFVLLALVAGALIAAALWRRARRRAGRDRSARAGPHCACYWQSSGCRSSPSSQRAPRSVSSIPSSRASTSRAASPSSRSWSRWCSALSLYTASFIAEIVRAGILGVPKGQTEAAQALGPHARADAAPGGDPAGGAHHHPAAHQPVSQPHQELLAGGGDRLSRLRQRVHRHGAEPDRPGGGGDPA